MSQPRQESQSRLSFQAFCFEMSLNRSVPAERLKSRGLLFPFGSPPPPRFATFGLGLALAGGAPTAPPSLLPVVDGGDPGAWPRLLFWPLGARGSEAEDPRLPQAGRKASVGLETNSSDLRLPLPHPQRDPMRPFFAG